jgi:hypothetical protein
MRQTGLGSIFQSREQAHDHISNRMVENMCNYIACLEDSSFYAALQAIIQNVEDMRGSGKSLMNLNLEDPAFGQNGQLHLVS